MRVRQTPALGSTSRLRAGLAFLEGSAGGRLQPLDEAIVAKRPSGAHGGFDQPLGDMVCGTGLDAIPQHRAPVRMQAGKCSEVGQPVGDTV